MLFANANVFFDDRGFVPAGLRVENGVFADVLPPESMAMASGSASRLCSARMNCDMSRSRTPERGSLELPPTRAVPKKTKKKRRRSRYMTMNAQMTASMVLTKSFIF